MSALRLIRTNGRSLRLYLPPVAKFHSSPKCLDSKKIFDDSDEKMQQLQRELKMIDEKNLYPEYGQTERGVIFDKKPIKLPCIEGKAYFWCTCGYSHKQPFCDGTHKNQHLKITLKPLRWDCKESKEYWFCNCKQSNTGPFCDGTHRGEKVQSASTTIRDVHSPPMVVEKIKKK